MPAPALLAAFAPAAKWAVANPSISVPIASTALSSVYRWIRPDRASELQAEVLQSQTDFRDRLARQAFGNFTAAERQQIQAAAQPQVNQIAANVARRGLGQSGAGAQLVTQAQQAPILHAQQTAAQTLPLANQALLQGSQYLLDDNSFFEDLNAISRELTLARENNEDTTELSEAIRTIFEGINGTGAVTIPNTTSPFLPEGERKIGARFSPFLPESDRRIL